MSSSRIMISIGSAVVSMGLAIGCSHSAGGPSAQGPSPVGEQQATPVAVEAPPSAVGGGPSSASHAMDLAIHKRCEREQRCDNVGDQRPYASMDDCIANVAIMHADDFAGLQCEGSVRNDALSDCIQEIERDTCTPGARFASCRSIGLCNSI